MAPPAAPGGAPRSRHTQPASQGSAVTSHCTPTFPGFEGPQPQAPSASWESVDKNTRRSRGRPTLVLQREEDRDPGASPRAAGCYQQGPGLRGRARPSRGHLVGGDRGREAPEPATAVSFRPLLRLPGAGPGHQGPQCSQGHGATCHRRGTQCPGHGQGARSDGWVRVREGTQRSEGRGQRLPGGRCGRLGTRGAPEPGSPSQEPCVWKRLRNRSVKQRDPPKRPREGKTAPSLEEVDPPAGKLGWGPRREQAGQDPSPSAAPSGGRRWPSCRCSAARSPAAAAASSATFTEKVNSGVLQLSPKSDSDLPPGEGKARSCLRAGPGSVRRPWSCRWPGVSWLAGLHPGPAGGRTHLPSTPRLTEGQRACRQIQVPRGQG